MIGRPFRRIRVPKKSEASGVMLSRRGGWGGGGGAARKCCPCAGTGPWIILGDDYWQKEGLSSDKIWCRAVTQGQLGGGGGAAKKSCQCAGTRPWIILGHDYWQNEGLSLRGNYN